MAIRRRHTIPATFLLLSVLLLLTFIHPTLAACECGYLATIRPDLSDPSTHTTALFTDILETDFSRLLPPANQDGDPSSSIVGTDLAKYTPDWAPQAFNLTAKRARGEYGEMFDVGNVRVVDPAAQGRGMAGDGRTLELVVRKGLVDGMVPVAEVDTRRLDVGYGTFRAVMKVPGVKGTCAAFFWYHNDTQEIDIEFLSKDFSPSRSHFPVNLVLQSRRSAEAGHDASGTENFVQTTLPFDPTADFHEYRIDYLPGMVVFYADGAPLATMTSASGVPTTAGHLILSHWSNGNPLWSGGPPREDAVLKVRSVKAYFNSSVTSVLGRRDGVGETGKCQVCRIPDVMPGNKSAADWFFTDGKGDWEGGDGDEDGGEDGGEDTKENAGRRGKEVAGWWVITGWVGVVMVSLAGLVG